MIVDPFIGAAFPLEATLYVPTSSIGPPSIAGNGTDYLVTWSTGTTIYASRVTSGGALLDPTPTVVVTGTANKTRPRAAWDGTEWFVVWGEDTMDYVLARRVRTDGTVIDQDASDVGLLVASALATSVDVAFDGTELFVVYAQNDIFAVPHVYGVRVGLNGQRIDTSPIVISNAAYPNRQTSPRVAFDGTEFFVAWADSRASASASATTWDIYGARVTHAGVLLDGPTDKGGTAIAIATGDQTSPVVTSDGNVAFVVWSDGRGATPAYYGARVDPSTGLVDGPASTGGVHLGNGTTSNAADAAFDGSQYDVVWSTYDGTTGGIVGARVAAGANGSAAVTTPMTVTAPPPWTDQPAIAGASSGSLVGWVDPRLGRQTLFGTRMNGSGAFLDGTASARGFCISEEPVTRAISAVGTNGTGFLAAWVDDREGPGTSSIFAERLDSGGTPLDKPAFPVAVNVTAPGALSVGSSGDGYVVTWTEGGNGQPQVEARFVDATGALVNGPATNAALTLTNASIYWPTGIAFDGSDYLFVWEDTRNADPTTGTGTAIYGLKTSATGVVEGATASTDGSFPIAAPTTYDAQEPVVDFDGTNFLVVWTGQNYALVGSRLASDGTRLDGTLTTDGFTIQPNISSPIYSRGLAYDGANHLVLSADSASLFAHAISTTGTVSAAGWTQSGVSWGILTYDGSVFWALWNAPAGASNVVGVRLRGDGSPRDTTPLTIDGSGNDALASAVGFSGEALVTFGIGGDTDGVIILDDATNGVACTSGASCASGVCEDGVCCDRPCGGSTPDCQACSRAAGAARDGVCGLAAAASVCRPMAGACDIAETCDGVSTTCPADRFVKINTVCHPETSCSSSAACTGTSAACPDPTPVTNGATCDGGTCASGQCMGTGGSPDAGTGASGAGGGAGRGGSGAGTTGTGGSAGAKGTGGGAAGGSGGATATGGGGTGGAGTTGAGGSAGTKGTGGTSAGGHGGLATAGDGGTTGTGGASGTQGAAGHGNGGSGAAAGMGATAGMSMSGGGSSGCSCALADDAARPHASLALSLVLALASVVGRRTKPRRL